MDFVLNEHTETLHEARDESGQKIATCGGLSHVSREHVQLVAERDDRTTETANRCGRCFRGEGGY